MIKAYEETHQTGVITIEDRELAAKIIENGLMLGDLGIQIAPDGRIWLCIDHVAFLRFKPIYHSKEGKK